MKINKLTYKAYGKLVNHEIDLHPEITVIFGNNEAGKSTIFNSISTLLYGFRPASREKHPYTHWQKNEINYSGIVQKDSELFLVERRLMSMPKLTIMALSSNMARNLRNEPLSFLPNVSENLYDAVFHLTSDDLNRADKESWEQIQEKLISNYGTNYLNKTSDVLKRLEQDVNTLWRKDKKGNPEINQLTSELFNLMQEKDMLEDQNEQLKQQIRFLEDVESTLEAFQTKRMSIIEKLQGYRSKLPQKVLKEKVQVLKNGLYKASVFEALDHKALERLNQLSESSQMLQNRVKRTEVELQALKLALNPLTETCANLLKFKPSVRQLEQNLAQLFAKEQEEHAMTQERLKLDEKIEAVYTFLFENQAPITHDVRSHLKQIKVMDLMSLVQNYIEGERKNDAIAQQEALKGQSKKVLALGFLLMGVVATAIGIFIKSADFLTLIGVGIIGFGLASYKPIKAVPASSVNTDLLLEKIQSIMTPLVLPAYVHQDVSFRFFSKLEELVMQLIESDQLWMKSERLRHEISEIQREMAVTLENHQLDTSSGVVISFQYAMSQIDKCEAQKIEEDQKHLRIENVTKTLEMDLDELREISNEVLKLRETFENFGDGYFDLGVEKFKENIEKFKKISIFSDEIERMPYTDEALDEVSEESIEWLESQRMQLDEDERALLIRRADLKNEISRLKENRSVEDVTSEILTTKDALLELEQIRDTRMLLFEIIKYADEQFRLENQPDIINRVSMYMRRMTDGKYTDVMISETLELQFLVDGELLPLSKAFSKGTIQQLFFAYRLAVIDVLDPECQLPMVLDEVFVNWDAIRLDQTLVLLGEIAKQRQIICFTCHMALVEKFKQRSNAKVIEVLT
jgi:uncharacterized protein YhaN